MLIQDRKMCNVITIYTYSESAYFCIKLCVCQKLLLSLELQFYLIEMQCSIGEKMQIIASNLALIIEYLANISPPF